MLEPEEEQEKSKNTSALDGSCPNNNNKLSEFHLLLGLDPDLWPHQQ